MQTPSETGKANNSKRHDGMGRQHTLTTIAFQAMAHTLTQMRQQATRAYEATTLSVPGMG